MAFVDLSEGFTLGLAECSLPPLRAALIAQVEQRCTAAGIQCIPVDLTDRPGIVSLKDELAEAARAHPTTRDRKQVMMVWGIESSVRITDELPPLLVGLNLARDAFVHGVRLPVVLWLPDYLLTTLSRVAPDFWAWRSATFRFLAPPSLLASLLAANAGLCAPGSNGKRPATWDRIVQLESLVQECLPSSGDVRDDRLASGLSLLLDLGATLIGMGDPDQAVVYLQRALSLARQLGDRQSEQTGLSALGAALSRGQEWHRAADCFRQSLAMARTTGDTVGQARALLELGAVATQVGDTTGAREHLTAAITLARTAGDSTCEAMAFTNLGAMWALSGDWAQAIPYLEQGAQIAGGTHDERCRATALLNLGAAHLELNALPAAAHHFRQAIQAARHSGEQSVAADSLLGLGVTLAQSGDIRAARATLIEAADAAHAAGDGRTERQARDRIALLASTHPAQGRGTVISKGPARR